MDHFGDLLLAKRKELSMTQASLAAILGVSQATVSRLETTAKPPSDIRLLKDIALFCQVPLAEFLPEEKKAIPDELFFAFCPNPLCKSNQHYLKDGEALVKWNSWTNYPACEFDETNYCPDCGSNLTKECSSCQRKFSKRESRFCVRCGEKISCRPTEEEWDFIRSTAHSPPAYVRKDEDIPF